MQTLSFVNGTILLIAGCSALLFRRQFGERLSRLVKAQFFRPIRRVGEYVEGEFDGEKTATHYGMFLVGSGIFVLLSALW